MVLDVEGGSFWIFNWLLCWSFNAYVFVENQVCCFVEALMKIFVVNGNQIGCFVEAFMHFVNAIN